MRATRALPGARSHPARSILGLITDWRSARSAGTRPAPSGLVVTPDRSPLSNRKKASRQPKWPAPSGRRSRSHQARPIYQQLLPCPDRAQIERGTTCLAAAWAWPWTTPSTSGRSSAFTSTTDASKSIRTFAKMRSGQLHSERKTGCLLATPRLGNAAPYSTPSSNAADAVVSIPMLTCVTSSPGYPFATNWQNQLNWLLKHGPKQTRPLRQAA